MQDGLANFRRETPAAGDQRADERMGKSNFLHLGGDVVDGGRADAVEHRGIERPRLVVRQENELSQAVEQAQQKDFVRPLSADRIGQATRDDGGGQRVFPDETIDCLAFDHATRSDVAITVERSLANPIKVTACSTKATAAGLGEGGELASFKTAEVRPVSEDTTSA